MGGRVALQIYRLAPDRVARIALLNTGSSPWLPGAAGEEETRKRGELVALAKSQGMRAMLRRVAASDDRFSPHQRHGAGETQSSK